jgi:hypothetical protein
MLTVISVTSQRSFLSPYTGFLRSDEPTPILELLGLMATLCVCSLLVAVGVILSKSTSNEKIRKHLHFRAYFRRGAGNEWHGTSIRDILLGPFLLVFCHTNGTRTFLLLERGFMFGNPTIVFKLVDTCQSQSIRQEGTDRWIRFIWSGFCLSGMCPFWAALGDYNLIFYHCPAFVIAVSKWRNYTRIEKKSWNRKCRPKCAGGKRLILQSVNNNNHKQPFLACYLQMASQSR